MVLRTSPLPPKTSIDGIPAEIWDNILYRTSNKSLSKAALASRAFHKYSNPYLYQYVFFSSKNLYSGHSGRPRRVGIHRKQDWLYGPDRSSQIFQPGAFLRTITGNQKIRAYIVGASLEWAKEDANTEEAKDARRILELLDPFITLLHLRPSHFNIPFVQNTGVTSLDLPYIEGYEPGIIPGLRASIYAAFSISTLRHISLQDARTWGSFDIVSPSEEAAYAHTSNVVSLSLPNTVAVWQDLKEIISWPKALKSFHHEGNEKEEKAGVNRPSAKVLIDALYSQRYSLEELWYDAACGYGDEPYYITFGTPLRDFTQLKRMSVPIGCLFQFSSNGGSPPVYKMLPPNIEEMIIELPEDFSWSHWGDEYAAQDEQGYKDWLQSVANYKSIYFASLKRLVVWQWDHWLLEYFHDGPSAVVDSYTVMQELGILPAFVEAKIDFKLEFTKDCPEFATDEPSE